MFKPDIVKKNHWFCPDENGPSILTMCNIPRPLHTLAPRTLLGGSTWDFMRKKCYMDAGYKCEICGKDLENDRRQAHELYSYDFANQTATFVRAVCVCTNCHQYFIHSGRALSMYKQGNPLYTKERLLEGVEHGFTIINSYNKEHPDKEPIRVYSAMLDYAKQPDLKDEMEELIQKYDIKFYTVREKWWDRKRWKNWRLIIGNREYPTPFESGMDWKEKMDLKSKEEGDDRSVKNPFQGGTYDEIAEILKNP